MNHIIEEQEKDPKLIKAESVSYNCIYGLCIIVLCIRVIFSRGLPAGDILFVMCLTKAVKDYSFGRLTDDRGKIYSSVWWALLGFGNLLAHILELPKYTF